MSTPIGSAWSATRWVHTWHSTGLRDPRIKAVVSCAGGLPVESKSKFPPVLMLQGASDKGNPLARVKAFEEVLKAQETPYETHIYRGMGHNFELYRWDDAARRLESSSTST